MIQPGKKMSGLSIVSAIAHKLTQPGDNGSRVTIRPGDNGSGLLIVSAIAEPSNQPGEDNVILRCMRKWRNWQTRKT
jgi:hypothetical protein